MALVQTKTISIFSLIGILFWTQFSLFAYVVIPRSGADTTDRMNGGGDPPDRPGLRDGQRSPEYLDDWWGVNDYYYSRWGIRETGMIYDPEYNSINPPYYPLPNYYHFEPNADPYYYHYNSSRYYRPAYPYPYGG